MKFFWIYVVIVSFCQLLISQSALAQRSSSELFGSNFFGSDYRNFETETANQCKAQCLGDNLCKAWTFVRETDLNPVARCWLKDEVPLRTADECCTSGVIDQPLAVSPIAQPKRPSIPMARVNGIEVTLAERATSQHVPRNANDRFSHKSGSSFYITFNSTKSRGYLTHFVDVELYSAGSNRRFDGWRVQMSHGIRYSIEMNYAQLPPGDYRVVIKEGGQASIPFTIASKYPRALELTDEVISLANSDWELESEFKEWVANTSAINIASTGLGGSVKKLSAHDNKRWSSKNLNDGLQTVALPEDPSNCLVCGWLAPESRKNATIELTFRDGQTAAINAVVLDTRIFAWSEDGSYANSFPKHVRIHASVAGASKIVSEAFVPQARGRFIIPVPSGTKADRIKVEIEDTHGGWAPSLAEIEIWEDATGETSIMRDAKIDLAHIANGGRVLVAPRTQRGLVGNLVSANVADTKWLSNEDAFPRDFVFGFKGNKQAIVDQIVVNIPKSANRESRPAEVSIEISDSLGFSNWREVSRHSLPDRQNTHNISVGQQARYVRLRILSHHGDSTAGTLLSGLSVIEGAYDEDAPLLNRAGQLESSQSPGGLTQEIDATEIEPNDDLQTAKLLPRDGGQAVGRISPLGEKDFWVLPELSREATAITIQYQGLPAIRHQIAVHDADGKVIKSFDPSTILDDQKELTFKLEEDSKERFISLSEPIASTVVVWDTSGSMRGSESELRSAVTGFINSAGNNQQIGLISFSQNVKTLTPKMTSNTSGLRSALSNAFSPEGATSLYDALLRAINMLESAEGNKSILIMSDGDDTSSVSQLTDVWDQLDSANIRVFAIGLGEGLGNVSYQTGASGRDILRALAGATDGAAFFTPKSTELKTFFRQISDRITQPATYILNVSSQTGKGTIDLLATAERVPTRAFDNVHIIYDLSGSMNYPVSETDPSLRIDIARRALGIAVDVLPEGVPLSFTTFGETVSENSGKELACKDITTKIPLKPFDKVEVRKEIDSLSPNGGTTPLIGSIVDVARKYSEVTGHIIVVTDGVDECDLSENRPEKLKQELLDAAGDSPHYIVNVIAFAVDDQKAIEEMQAIAAATNGRFLKANDIQELTTSLRQMLLAKYKILDSGGAEVVSGRIDGGPVELPSGLFDLEIAAQGKSIREPNIRIDNGARTIVEVRKVGEEVGITTGAPIDVETLLLRQSTCGKAAPTRDPDFLVERVQAKLTDLKFEPGGIDNKFGTNTERAIRAFQAKFGIALDGAPDIRLEQHLDCVAQTRMRFIDKVQ